jgi:hypothetical protein
MSVWKSTKGERALNVNHVIMHCMPFFEITSAEHVRETAMSHLERWYWDELFHMKYVRLIA